MNNIKRYIVSDIGEYIKKINEIKEIWNEKHQNPEYPFAIFRGQRNCWPLKPSIFRVKGRGPKYIYSEFKVYNSFKRFILSIDKELAIQNNLDLIMNMQHYNVPTRLLDWTENCLTALYFALIKAGETDRPIIWMLHSGKMNSLTFEGINAPFLSDSIHARSRADLIGYIKDKKLKEQYFQDFEEYKAIRQNLDKPICFAPNIVNKRIAVQQSIFTIHGINNDPIEDYFDGDDGLIGIEIENSKIKILNKELFNIGIRPRNIFPDIEGLAEELKQDHYKIML